MKCHLRITRDFELIPVEPEAVKYIFNRSEGDILSCDIKIARSYPQLKRFMKFIQVCFDMQEHFEQQEAFRYWLVMKAGYFDTIVAPNGNTMFKAKSLAFDNMDEDVFVKVFSECIDVFLKEFGNGMSESDLMEIIGFA